MGGRKSIDDNTTCLDKSWLEQRKPLGHLPICGPHPRQISVKIRTAVSVSSPPSTFAKRRGFVIEDVYTDDAVSGDDDIASRPGFSSMLDALESNGVKTVLVEDAPAR